MSASWPREIADLQAQILKITFIGSMCSTCPEARTLQILFFFGTRKYLVYIGSLCSTYPLALTLENFFPCFFFWKFRGTTRTLPRTLDCKIFLRP
jgi:hypothetical protein